MSKGWEASMRFTEPSAALVRQTGSASTQPQQYRAEEVSQLPRSRPPRSSIDPGPKPRRESRRGSQRCLNISPYTVETHRSHILQKLNLHNSAELVLYAVRKGIIS